jgi:DNA-binding response OmpR family regulator
MTIEKKNKILIIEDEKTLLEMYSLKLEKEGFAVVKATNGEAGIEAAKKTNPDVILLDVMMPKIDGFAVLEKLKKFKTFSQTPIILMTNLGQEEDIKKGKRAGATDYLVKSENTPAQVAAKVGEILNK